MNKELEQFNHYKLFRLQHSADTVGKIKLASFKHKTLETEIQKQLEGLKL